jgi:type I restriction enzyme S subunit
MNAERLLAHYEQIADVPDGIARLRRFILDLAVRGKLVAQDRSDEPASKLVNRIAVERNAWAKKGEIRKAKAFLPMRVTPFDLPKGWEWLRLGETGNIFTGNSIDPATRDRLEREKVGRPFVATKDVGYGFDPIDYDNGLLVSISDKTFKVARAHSVLICAEGGSAGRKIGIAARDICFGNKLLANETWSVVSPRFVMFVYLSAFFYEQFVAQMTGVIGGISINKFLQLPFPLAPFAEQHRIVAKVDELMTLCDRLEAARGRRETARDRLAAASLARLNAPDSEILQADARFALNVLPAFTTRPDQIKQFRQTVLNLAVRGKLVPQDARDETSRLPPLRQFAAASGMDDEVFEQFRGSMILPSGWQIAPLAQLSDNIVDCPHTTPKWMDKGEICIRTNQLRPRVLDLSAPRYVSPEAYIERIERLQPKADDILYSREGGILGIACRVPHGVRLCLGQRLMLIRAGAETRADFLEIVLNSPLITDIAKACTTGGAAPRVNMSTVRAYPIPVPPLAEQHRIVAKVDMLMALCDRLEASLTAAAATRRRLLDALLAEALTPLDALEMEAAE